MNTHKIRQEWLTPDEAVTVLLQHNIPLLPADLFRHALHGDLTFSVYFPSPVLLRPLNLSCRLACREAKIPFLYPQCSKPGNRRITANTPPFRRDPSLRLSTTQLWDLPMLGLERLLLHHQLAQALEHPQPEETWCCNQAGIVVRDEQGQLYQLCRRKPVRELLMELLGVNGKLPEELHLLISQLYCHARGELQSRLQLPICYLPDTLPADAILVIRRIHLEAFLTRHQPETRERITAALSRLLWLACKHNPQLNEELLEHPYKLLTVFESWAQEEGLNIPPLNGETLKNALRRGAPFSP